MYHFIINPKSSSGKSIRFWWKIKNQLEERNVPFSTYMTRKEGDASHLAGQICKKIKGIKNIVVVGGDGSLNEVINGITDFDKVILGYIPSGSSNDFARSLKIPKDPVKALNKILNPKKFKYLDIGVIHFPNSDTPSRKFCCSSGMGYDASVCMEVQASSLKKKFNKFGLGKLVYLTIAIKQLLTIKPVDGNIKIDGIEKKSFKDILIVSNMIHPYAGGGIKMAPNADPTDGKLSIMLAHGLSRFKTMILLPTILFGQHVKYKEVKTFNCSNIEINVDNDTAVHTDGEVPAVCSHIKVECLPRKIRMIL